MVPQKNMIFFIYFGNYLQHFGGWEKKKLIFTQSTQDSPFEPKVGPFELYYGPTLSSNGLTCDSNGQDLKAQLANFQLTLKGPT